MSGEILTVQHQKEALPFIYVKALAARARYATSAMGYGLDSVDLRIHAGGNHRPSVDLQLKAATTLEVGTDGRIRYRLPIKNYNDLRIKTMIPRLLVVLDLPKDESQWMTVTDEELVLKRRAYWLSLQLGFNEVGDQATVTVSLPDAQRLNVESLRHLMEQARRGQIP
jgi:hypothetical protein